ncbi:3D domain-containing protein [Solidesulfovibrio sp.]|uniref:3D domain-containing protein n=1 Tax=Solidesulfovibrio sp. TaxID=2910990 RepID=UPI002B21E797|nr:3D domain-containing protein [Solidesulfovibrio sp.]MEA4856942.1 3D domain-containing protein [Solidesulfovibrio sp.]
MRVFVFAMATLALAVTVEASQSRNISLGKLSPKKRIEATVTAYTPDPRENGGRGSRTGTALGTPIRPGIVAVSRDLLRSGWDFGDKIHIEGLGVFTIEDTMHQRFRRTIDVAVPNRAAARKIGKMKNIEVTLLEAAPGAAG